MAALRKLDQGTYGICERCGKPISPPGSKPSRLPLSASTAPRFAVERRSAAGARLRRRASSFRPMSSSPPSRSRVIVAGSFRHHAVDTSETRHLLSRLHPRGHPARGQPRRRRPLVRRRHGQASGPPHPQPAPPHRPLRVDRGARRAGLITGAASSAGQSRSRSRSIGSAIRVTSRARVARRPGDEHHPGGRSPGSPSPAPHWALPRGRGDGSSLRPGPLASSSRSCSTSGWSTSCSPCST